MRTPIQHATDFWSEPGGVHEHRAVACWLAKPLVRQYVNESIGGARPLWALDWFKSIYPRRFSRGLSIGCGAGGFDRWLIEREICERVDAFDGAVGSLSEAQRESEACDMQRRIRYFAADFNTVSLPESTYDIIFFHQSLHHVELMERLLRQVFRALKPDGILYADEYVGPSRYEWTPAQLAVHQVIYSLLPREWRFYDRVPPPIEYTDPSEAVRSSEIIKQLSIGFDFIHRRDYGGTLLSVLIPIINWDVAPEEFQNHLIAAEKEWLSSGRSAYSTVIVATRKPGLRGGLGRLRYLLEPKWRGARMRISHAVGKPAPF